MTAGGNASGATAASARVADAQAPAIAINHVSMMFAGRDASQRVHALDDDYVEPTEGPRQQAARAAEAPVTRRGTS